MRADIGGKAALQLDAAGRLALPTRRLDRLLEIHAGVENVRERLGEKLRLAEPARRADREHRFSAFENQRGAQRMRGKFPRRELVRMSGNEIESGRAVVE